MHLRRDYTEVHLTCLTCAHQESFCLDPLKQRELDFGTQENINNSLTHFPRALEPFYPN